MSAETLRAAVLSSVLLALIGGCATASEETGSGGQGGALTGAGGFDASVTSSTSSAQASAASAASATSSSAGSGGGEEPCMNTDPGEPNDTAATAYAFGPIGCSDSSPGKIYGVLADEGDVDWFVYDGQDEISCQVNPTVGVSVSAGIARVCAYFACVGSADTDLGACPLGTSTDQSADGWPGCCGTTDFTVDLNCTGTINDESLVYLRVDDPTHGSTCAPYTVTFHY